MTSRKMTAAGLLLVPALAVCAPTKGASPAAAAHAAVVRTLPRGTTLAARGQQYQVIGGARAVTRMAGEAESSALARAAATPADVIERKGHFLFVRDAKASATAVAPETDGARLPVVVNVRTGKLGVLPGVVSATVREGADATEIAAEIASSNGLVLVSTAPRIGAAFFRVPAGRDLPAAAAAVASHPDVASAELDVIENPAVPH
jgi:hypothetical protein